MMRSRPLGLSLLLMAATLAAGLLLRFARLGLPLFVSKYGGSMLWALMIYWLVTTLLPRFSLARGAVLAGILAAAVELLKLYRTPSLDAFRLTLPGILLLGRFFSLWDIVAYWLAIALGAIIDSRMRPMFAG